MLFQCENLIQYTIDCHHNLNPSGILHHGYLFNVIQKKALRNVMVSLI